MEMNYKGIVLFCLLSGLFFGCMPNNIQTYEEPVVLLVDLESNSKQKNLNGSVISTGIRVFHDSNFEEETREWKQAAWKGEQVFGQLVLWSDHHTNISWKVTDLEASSGKSIPSSRVDVSPVMYVQADEFGNGCGSREGEEFDLVYSADLVDSTENVEVYSSIPRPIWFSILIPPNAGNETYQGKLTIESSSGQTLEFDLEVQVQKRQLSPFISWQFHLDLWQNPFAVARFHKVKPWSEEHFAIMKPILKKLGQAGGVGLTVSIIDQPWNSQTYDPFESMIKVIKKNDGTWAYDYSIFDRYVELGKDCYLNHINCYTIVPWHNQFTYYTEDGQKQTIEAKPGTVAYNDYWRPFLKDFVYHMRVKEWFDDLVVAMDERSEEEMKSAIALLKEAESDFKIALAGEYHPSIENDVYDYSIASNYVVPVDTMNHRGKKQKLTTFYTCCVENRPNTFTFSPSAEAEWIPWYAAAKGYDGYLRWAYNSWTKNPEIDTRFRKWPSGDTYLIYPGARSSVRFDLLYWGIQTYEKIRILRNVLYRNQSDELKRLDSFLETITIENLSRESADEMIIKGRKIIAEITDTL
jgi:hypothetical protein